ncbi:hypothetical protein [Halalkalicoccus tibetensis]|uniref:ABC-2 type transport system permease protein n=1 Tax=Halalkalicoccus tibetensis TaxID=175632 RepID=A0ABD5UXU0_9EURY
MASLTKPRLIARTELRRSSRAFRTNRYQLIATAAFGLFFLLPLLVFGSIAARELGETLAAGGTIGGFDPVPLVRAVVAVYWAVFVFFVASRAVGKTATVDEPEAVLTAVSVPTALAGTLLAEVVLVGLWLVPPVVVIVGAFALGAGSPLVILAAALALALMVASAIPIGYLVGLGIRHLLTVNETLARYKTAIGAAAFVLYFGALAFAESLFADLFGWIGRLPVGWLADLVLLGAPGVAPSAPRAGAAVGLSVLAGGGALVGAVRLADRHWFADPARDSRPATRTGTGSNRSSPIGRIGRVGSRPTRATARVVWLRVRRAPIRLLYAAYPLFGLLIFANDLSTVLPYLPAILTLYVIWAAGAAFTLNPLGDQAGALAATLTTPVSGEQFVRGHLLVATTVFAPLGLLVSVGSGYLVGLAPDRIALLAAASVLGVLAAASLASGVGTVFARFGAVRLSGSHETVMPSKSAFATYSLLIGLTVAALGLLLSELARTTVALLATGLVLDRFSMALSSDTVLTGAVIVLIGSLALPPVAYVHAARTFDRFTISQ